MEDDDSIPIEPVGTYTVGPLAPLAAGVTGDIAIAADTGSPMMVFQYSEDGGGNWQRIEPPSGYVAEMNMLGINEIQRVTIFSDDLRICTAIITMTTFTALLKIAMDMSLVKFFRQGELLRFIKDTMFLEFHSVNQMITILTTDEVLTRYYERDTKEYMYALTEK